MLVLNMIDIVDTLRISEMYGVEVYVFINAKKA